MGDKQSSEFFSVAPKIVPDEPKENKQRIQTKVLMRRDSNLNRRAFSEIKLLELVAKEFPFADGQSFNFITGGDIDSLSFLKIILLQQNLEYCLLSTWCMASEDIYQIEEWLDNGKIKKIDAYVGEIFPNTYKKEYELFKPIIQKHGGRIAVFKNHSKIFAGYGDRFYFSIQSSANINTNPRCENACIQIGKDSFEFYKEFYDGIKSFC